MITGHVIYMCNVTHKLACLSTSVCLVRDQQVLNFINNELHFSIDSLIDWWSCGFEHGENFNFGHQIWTLLGYLVTCTTQMSLTRHIVQVTWITEIFSECPFKRHDWNKYIYSLTMPVTLITSSDNRSMIYLTMNLSSHFMLKRAKKQLCLAQLYWCMGKLIVLNLSSLIFDHISNFDRQIVQN